MKNQTAEILNVKNSYGVADTTATVVVKNSLKRVPKVSVIIPVYNVEQYLRECLDSVLNQTLKDIQILYLWKNNTNLQCYNIIKNISLIDERIVIFENFTTIEESIFSYIGSLFSIEDNVY